MTLVALIICIICLLIVTVGVLGVASPQRLLALVRKFQTPLGLYFAGAIRIVLGAALFFAAPNSRAPDVVRILGIVVIVIGIITPFFGLERFRRLLDWFSAQGVGFVRGWAVIAMGFGLLLAYAVLD